MGDKPMVAIGSTEREIETRSKLLELLRSCPIPDSELLSNLGLFLNRQTLSRILFMHLLYQQILTVHGIVVEFGVRWGQNMAVFSSFRGMYEPFNYTRRIVGFDTFAGFPHPHAKDGDAPFVKAGAYGVAEEYENYLDEILRYHEQESPIPHIKKYEIVKGDAAIELDRYLHSNPETIIALAYFDLDLYEPTLKCLERIKPHLTKGSVLGFDELANHWFPGETLALRETLGLDTLRIRRVPWNPNTAYAVVGE